LKHNTKALESSLLQIRKKNAIHHTYLQHKLSKL